VPYGKFWPLGWRGRIGLIALVVGVWSPAVLLTAVRVRRTSTWLIFVALGAGLTVALLAAYWSRLCFVF
jgi:hypothetical protein